MASTLLFVRVILWRRSERGPRGFEGVLLKRPKVFVLEFGNIDDITAGVAFAAIMHGAVIVTDQNGKRSLGFWSVHPQIRWSRPHWKFGT